MIVYVSWSLESFEYFKVIYFNICVLYLVFFDDKLII